MNSALTEMEIFELYCLHYGKEIGKLLDASQEIVYSPFYANNRFEIDCNKLKNIYSFNTSFEQCLERELKNIDC